MKSLFALVLVAITTVVFAQKELPIVKSNNSFAIDFYQKLCKDHPNKSFSTSPYSILEAIAMTYNGANNQTKKEMQKVLGFPYDNQELNNGFRALSKQLKSSTVAIDFAKANSMWAQKDYSFLPEYFNIVESYYDASLGYVDFKKKRKRKKATETINKWALDNTSGQIDKLISFEDLTKNTRLVLANTIFFDAKWEYTFDSDKNRTETFNGINGSEKTTFMRLKTKLSFYYDDLIDVLELPYQGGQQSLFILLPKKQNGLAQLEKTFDQFYLENIIADKRKHSVIVTIPKIEIKSDFELSKVMHNMGLQSAFNNTADFSGMTGNTDLFIDKIFHNCNIKISEEGTKAAAASAVIIARKSGMREMVFMADHPFMYLIRDNKTGSVLFLGRVLSVNQ